MYDSISYPFEPPAKNSYREIAPGIYWIRLEIPIVHDHINVWALDDGDGWALVDTGVHCEQTLTTWQALMKAPPFNRPITKIIATHMHPDHVGLAGWFNKQFGTPLHMSRIEYLTCRVLIQNTREQRLDDVRTMFYMAGWTEIGLNNLKDTFGHFIHDLPENFHDLVDGESITVGEYHWKIINVGGHTPDHSCLYCAELKMMISGDQILPLIAPNIPVIPMQPTANPMQEWLASIDKIGALVAEDTLVLPAHDDCFYGVHVRLEALRQRQAKAVQRLLDHLSEPRRVIDTFPALFRRPIDLSGAQPTPLKMATGEAMAQLNYLLGRGMIQRELIDGVAYYQRASH